VAAVSVGGVRAPPATNGASATSSAIPTPRPPAIGCDATTSRPSPSDTSGGWIRLRTTRASGAPPARRSGRGLNTVADETVEWRDAAESGDAEIRVSPERLREFEAELRTLIGRDQGASLFRP